MTTPVVFHTDELLTLTVTIEGEWIRVRAAGEVDASSTPRLNSALGYALAGGARQVVVDLDAVTFLDSSGLSALALGHRRAAATGIHLQVAAAGPAARRALEVSGLWQLLGTEPACPGRSHAA